MKWSIKPYVLLPDWLGIEENERDSFARSRNKKWNLYSRVTGTVEKLYDVIIENARIEEIWKWVEGDYRAEFGSLSDRIFYLCSESDEPDGDWKNFYTMTLNLHSFDNKGNYLGEGRERIFANLKCSSL